MKPPAALLLLLVPLLWPGATEGASSPPYYTDDFFTVCPSDGSKKEISLGTTSAVLTLQVGPAGLGGRPFNCHLELEAPSKEYGFHVFMEEMHLAGEESGSAADGGCALDYVQFARDDLFFTTYKSPRYCGSRRRLNATDPDSVARAYDGGRTRFYVEERDREMDLWVHLDGDYRGAARNLTLVATVFKKRCRATDRRWLRCPYTDNCVRRELVCDGRTNCAWPDGDAPADEAKCDAVGAAASGDVFAPANIPVIIVVAVVTAGVLVVFVVACRTFYRAARGNSPGAASPAGRLSRRLRRRADPGGPAAGDSSATPLSLPAGGAGPGADLESPPPSAPPEQTELPTAPPKYEDVVENPPPYSEGV